MGIININAYITNKTFHVSPIAIVLNCDKGQYQVLGYGLFVLVPGAIPRKSGGYYSPGDQISYEASLGYEGKFKKLINIQQQRNIYWFDSTEEAIKEACRTQGTSTAGFTTIKNNGNGSFTATMPDGKTVTWGNGGKGFDGFVDNYVDLPNPTQHLNEAWYVINTTIPAALGNVWYSDGNNWISSLTLLKTKGDLFTYSTEQDILPLGANGYVLSVDTTTSTGFKYVPFTPLPVGLGSANQILAVNNAGTALEYKTVSISTTPILGDVGLTLTTANALIINLPSASTTVRGVLTSIDWNTFNNKQNALTFGNLTDVGTDGITVTGGTGAVIGAGTTLSQHVSDATHNGYLSSTDWVSFNSKLTSTLSNTKIFIGSIGNVAVEQTLSLNATGGAFALSAAGVITFPNADTSTRGLLTAADWNTFNSKESALTFSTGLTRLVNTITANLSTGVAGGQTAIGGTGVADALTIKGTTGNGTSTVAAINFVVGNNGGTNAASVLNNGYWGFLGISPLSPISIGRLGLGGAIDANALSNNCYWDGSDWRYIITSYATRLEFNTSGKSISVYSVSSGAAGSIASMTQNIVLGDSAHGSAIYLLRNGGPTYLESSQSTSPLLINSINGNNVGIGGAAVSQLTIPVQATANPNFGSVSLGGGAFDGVSAGFFSGSAAGTQFAINSTSVFIGGIVNWQRGGINKYKLDYTGASQQSFDNSNYFTITPSATGVIVFDAVGSGASFTFSDNVLVNAPLGFVGNIIEGQVNGTSKFKVSQNGTCTIATLLTNIGGNGTLLDADSLYRAVGNSALNLYNDGSASSQMTLYGNTHANLNLRKTFLFNSGSNVALSGTSLAYSFSSSYVPTTAASTIYHAIDLSYTLNGTAGAQSGSGTGLFMNGIETTLNGLAHKIFDFQINSISRFNLSNTAILTHAIDNANFYTVTVGATGTITYSATGGTAGFTFSQAVTVPYEVYGSGWNGSNQAPTKDAIYDKIQALYIGINASETPITTTGGIALLAGDAVTTRLVDATAGNIVITITPATSGQIIYLQRLDGTGNTITVQMNAGTLNWAASQLLTGLNSTMAIQFLTTNSIIL